VHSWNIFYARTNHEHTKTHKTHHNLNLDETPTFPLIIFSVIGHGGYTQMSFFPEFRNQESRNSRNWNSRHFAGP
jgi:hypothetical protein